MSFMEMQNGDGGATLFGAVQPDLEVLVPEQNRIALHKRISTQHFRHPVQLIAFLDVIDFTWYHKKVSTIKPKPLKKNMAAYFFKRQPV